MPKDRTYLASTGGKEEGQIFSFTAMDETEAKAICAHEAWDFRSEVEFPTSDYGVWASGPIIELTSNLIICDFISG